MADDETASNTGTTDGSSSLTDFVNQSLSDLDNLSSAQLNELGEDMILQNKMLAVETGMLEKHWIKVDPAAAERTNAQTQIETNQSRRRKSRFVSAQRQLRLTAKLKCEIAQRELEDLREEIEKTRQETEKQLDSHRSVIEENDERLKDMGKYRYEFERDMIFHNGKSSNQSGKHFAVEKYVRFTEEKTKSREGLIEKLRLKNSKLQDQNRKLKHQLKQKEEMDEVLHEVDFNQLKIENKQYLEKIEDKNSELLKLKLQTGETTNCLNQYKGRLTNLVNCSEKISSSIETKEDLLTQLREEINIAEAERKRALDVNQKLKKIQSEYKVPTVFDYVTQTAKHGELKITAKAWQRKVDISKMANKTQRKKWRHAQNMMKNDFINYP